MASSAPNKAFLVRAAAILTTSEVAGFDFDLNQAWGGEAEVQIDFTVGSLTNGIIRFYVSQDGVTYYPLETGPGTVSRTYTVSTTVVIPVWAAGSKLLRVSVQGTGTVTSSSAAVSLRYLKAGSQ